jgi:hypothetical protein
MGGLETEVTDATTRVLLESARASIRCSIRRTARRLGLHCRRRRSGSSAASIRRWRRAAARGAPAVHRRWAAVHRDEAVDRVSAPAASGGRSPLRMARARR